MKRKTNTSITRIRGGSVSYGWETDPLPNENQSDSLMRDILVPALIVGVIGLLPVAICSQVSVLQPYVGSCIWAEVLLAAAAVVLLTLKLSFDMHRELTGSGAVANSEDRHRRRRSSSR